MSYHAKKSAGQRSTGLIIVVVFHVLLIWGLAAGLDREAAEHVDDDVGRRRREDADRSRGFPDRLFERHPFAGPESRRGPAGAGRAVRRA